MSVEASPNVREAEERPNEGDVRERGDSGDDGVKREKSKRSVTRSRSPSRERSHRRSSSRDRRRDRDRRRSRSREGRRYRDEPRRDRRRHRSRSPRDRRGGYGVGNDRRGRRRDEGLTSAEDEQQKLERTYRTVQVYNLNLKAGEREVFEFFSKAGKVSDIKIIRDRASGRSKGFAYVEFGERDNVVMALSLSGQPLLGQPVMVKMSEAEKNMAWEAAQAAKKQAAAMINAGGMAGGGAGQYAMQGNTGPLIPGRLLVSNLPSNVVEADLRQVFDPFGPVDFLTLQRDGMGNSQGVALVQYKLAADAAVAAAKLNEGAIELAPGMPMQIVPAPLDYNPMAVASGAAGAVPPGLPGAPGGMPAPPGMPAAPATIEERIDVDADDGGGMKLTAQHRMALMTRLAATAGIEMPQAPTFGVIQAAAGGGGAAAVPGAIGDLGLIQGVLGPSSPIPTQCVLIKNMFNPEEESAPGWDEEISQEVREECSKFGPVVFVHVDANSKGFVYLKFATKEAATTAQKTLHGRWFNEKQLCAEFQFTPLFNAHFKL